MKRLHAGFSTIDITPQLPAPVQGHVNRPQPATELLGRLEASALALRGEEASFLLLSVDVLELSTELCQALSFELQSRIDIPAGHIVITATHTHTAPPAIRLGTMRPDPGHLQRLQEQLISCAMGAVEDLNPARVTYLRKRLPGIGINRRVLRGGRIRMAPNPDGPVEESLTAVRVRQESSGRSAAVVTFALHPTVLGVEIPAVSPDFPGPLRESVRSATGAETVLYLNGACGDVRPALIGEDNEFREGLPEEVERIGRAIGAAAGSGAGNQEELTDREMRAAGRELILPFRAIPSAEEYERTAEEHEANAEREAKPAPSVTTDGQDRHINRYRIERESAAWAREMAEARRNDTLPAAFRSHISVLSFGREAAFLFLPGEQFTETALRIMELSPFHHTVIVGYANGAAGYVPTASAMQYGGYEVEQAYKFYGFPAPYERSAAEGVVESSVQLLGPSCHDSE